MSNKKTTAGSPKIPLASAIRESAHQIWLAGLGAMGQAEARGARWFESLISLGEKIEQSARTQIARPVHAVEKTVNDARETAGDTWNWLELAFERRVANMLNSMQIPTSRDVEALTRRVEALQKTVAELTTRPVPSRRRAAGSGKAAKRAKTPARKKVSRPPRTAKPRAASGRKVAKPSAASKTRIRA